MQNKQTILLVVISVVAAATAAFVITSVLREKPNDRSSNLPNERPVTPRVQAPKTPLPASELKNPDALERRRVLMSLQREGNPANADALFDLLATETDAGLRVLAFAALGQMQDPTVASRLLGIWRESTDERTRLLALEEASRIGGPEVQGVLLQGLRHKEKLGFDAQVHGIAANGLVSKSFATSKEALDTYLKEGTEPTDKDPDSGGRSALLEALAGAAGPEHLAMLLGVAGDHRLDADLRDEAVECIALMETPESIAALLRIFEEARIAGAPGDDDPRLADKALTALGDIEDPRARTLIRSVATGEIAVWDDLRRTALQALGRIGGEGAADVLRAAGFDASLSETTRGSAWDGYVRVAGAAAAEDLVNLLTAAGDGRLMRQMALRGLGHMPVEARKTTLERVVAGAQDPQTRAAAERMLKAK